MMKRLPSHNAGMYVYIILALFYKKFYKGCWVYLFRPSVKQITSAKQLLVSLPCSRQRSCPDPACQPNIRNSRSLRDTVSDHQCWAFPASCALFLCQQKKSETFSQPQGNGHRTKAEQSSTLDPDSNIKLKDIKSPFPQLQ